MGAPLEGVKDRHAFTADLQPAGIAENDDTDLQLLWLHALEEHGVRLTADHLVREWREHVRAPWNEYGVAAANWAHGLTPPESGRVNNWFWGECMGCPIRSEIWGAICPGAPELAARYAAMDGSLDHTGEAIEAEKFFAAIEAALFFEKDLDALIDVGLAQVDPGCRLAAMTRDVRQWARRHEWQQVRELVLATYGHPEMTHVLQNVGFVLIGLLCGGGDFGRTLALTLNCGYDSDCTAATAAAILGGMAGYSGIPEKYRMAVPEHYRVSDWMLGFPRLGSILELSLACCHLGLQAAEAWRTGVIISPPPGPPPARLPVGRVDLTEAAPPARRFPVWVVHGPFWRAWEERRQANAAMREHAAESLPSVHYTSHNQSGFDRVFLTPGQLRFGAEQTHVPELRRVCVAASDVLSLDFPESAAGPACYYAAAEFEAQEGKKMWLMAGATGPVEIWLNGVSVLHSETYQPLTPTTFPLAVTAVAGRNQLVLKLARTSQPLAACVAFKRFTGAHWHQSFYETGLNWIEPAR
ncbi:MAG: ADP-ribosylglycohydrolase family protein [Opitutaceae bacterium]|nr:ADP-ribosylglycohydrolase family protein [Opitutaceae bacterium]